MNKITETTLSKVMKSSKEIAPGMYRVKATVEVDAVVRKGEDYERAGTHKIPLKTALALFIQRTGLPGHKALDMLVGAMIDAANGVDPDIFLTDTAEKKVKEALGQAPKSKCTGAVTIQEKDIKVLHDEVIAI